MKNYLRLPISMTLVAYLGFTQSCTKAFALDVNLNGSANLNFNPANNNKYSTKLNNFAPGNIPLQQVDLSPLATPPATSVIKSFSGNKAFTEVADQDVKNEKEAKDLQRRTGQLVGKAPEPVADDQEVKDTDIQDFLASYYKYLRSEGLSSGSLPVIQSNTAPAKTKSSIKQKASSSNTHSTKSKQLQAKQQKLLLISKTPSTDKDEHPNSP